MSSSAVSKATLVTSNWTRALVATWSSQPSDRRSTASNRQLWEPRELDWLSPTAIVPATAWAAQFPGITVITIDPDCPPEVAVIVVVPGANPFTSPVPDTG